MTENEAKEYMENEIRCIQRASYCDRDCAKCELVKEEKPLLEAFGMAIQALEKVQAFEAIGTIEEFKALKEKSVAKKILRIPEDDTCIYQGCYCPNCMEPLSNTSRMTTCFCGQNLDWSE